MRISNTVKAVLYLGDIHNTNFSDWERRGALPIQSLDYTLNKDLSTHNVVDTITKSCEVELVVRTPDSTQIRELFNLFKDRDSHYYTLLFDPKYDSQNNLTEYRSAMVVDALLCKIRESYTKSETESELTNRLQLRLSLLARSICYSSSWYISGSRPSSNLKLTIL